MNGESRGPWYLLTGLILGLVFGLAYGWVFAPVKYVDTAPASMRADFKDQFRALIAVSYLSSGNLERARVRLSLIEKGDHAQSLADQAQKAISEGRPESEIQALGLLAAALMGQPVTLVTPVAGSPTPSLPPTETLTPTPLIAQTDTPEGNTTPDATSPPNSTAQPGRGTPTFTPTLLPTRTPTLTPGAAFVVQERELVCDLTVGEALIQVEILDAARQPVPGIEIVVRWDGMENYFVTGLKPEISLGYADFMMTPGIVYNLQLVAGSEPVSDLTVVECDGEAGRFWGNWRLTFIQP
jgi:hypothetical protein